MINPDDFKKSLSTLFAEIFGVSDAPSGFVLDHGRAGLLGTIDKVDAATASAALKPQNATLASHCTHVLYLLDLFLIFERGEQPKTDWEAAWRTRQVDAAAWQNLRSELHARYNTVAQTIQARDTWPEPAVGGSLVILTHCAYHVGEIKQLLTSLEP